MLIAVISEKNQGIISELEKLGGEFEKKIVREGEGAAILTEIARVPVDTLILDVDTGPGLGSAVLRYRLTRQNTRIILLAIGKEYGNPEVARVAQAGVYDIVTDVSKLQQVLDHEPAGIAAAAAWIDADFIPDSGIKKSEQEIIYKEKIVGTRTVAVASVSRGIGCTTFAIHASHFLAEYGRVLLIEINHYPVFYAVEQLGSRNIRVAQQSDQREVYVDNIINLMGEVDVRNFDFVVLDMGCYWEPNMINDNRGRIKYHQHKTEMNRAHLPILLAGAFEWQFWNLQPILYFEENQRDSKDMTLVFREPGDKGFIKECKNTFKDVYTFPSIENPYKVDEAAREVFKVIFRDIIPAERPRKSFLSWTRRR